MKNTKRKSEHSFFYLLGPFSVALSLGMQLWFIAFFVLGLFPPAVSVDALTDVGKYWFRPEHDLPVYFSGIGGIILFVLLFTYISTRRQSVNRSGKQLQETVWTQLSLSGFAALLFLSLLFFLVSMELTFWSNQSGLSQKLLQALSGTIVLALPGLSLLTYFIYNRRSNDLRYPRLRMQVKKIFVFIEKLTPILVPVFIFLFVYIPDWANLSGDVFIRDRLHHWNGFVVRSFLSFSHGLAFGTDIYAQYGVAWTILFSWINRLKQLTYGDIIGISVVYVCVYYSGLFLLLRQLTKSTVWSATGVIWVLFVQVFTKDYPNVFVWEHPSSTILRSPMDVWFFLTLGLSQNLSKKLFTWLTGIILGLAFLFGFDTGTYLWGSFGIYIIFMTVYLFRQRSVYAKDFVSSSFFASGLGITVIFVCLTVASRFTILDYGFWKGLVEGVFQYGTGVSQIPIVEVTSARVLSIFFFITGSYLALTGYQLQKFFIGQNKKSGIFILSLAAYGLLNQIIFIGRSHEANVLHPTLPFWVLMIWIISSLHRRIFFRLREIVKKRYFNYSNFLFRLLPGLVLFLTLVLVFANVPFRRYPNLFGVFYNESSGRELCLFNEVDDICGISREKISDVETYREVLGELKLLKSQGKDIAIFDWQDVVFQLYLNDYQWIRHQPRGIFTKKQLGDIKQEILNRKPEFLLIQSNGDYITEKGYQPRKTDVWEELHALLKGNATFKKMIGPYELWEWN